MDSISYHIQRFKKEKKRYEEEYKNYVEKCILASRENGSMISILTTEEMEMIDSLRQAILAAIALVDQVQISDGKTQKFLSGIRYINNMFKHSVFPFETSEITSAGIHISYYL